MRQRTERVTERGRRAEKGTEEGKDDGEGGLPVGDSWLAEQTHEMGN